MSSISGVSSVPNPYQTANQSGSDPISPNLQAIGSALQTGDVSSAQSALSSFQQALQGASSATANQPFGKNAQANTDYQSLTSSLQSGNISGAQKAFTSLQSDLKSAQATELTHAATSAHKGHHHHHVAAPASTTAAVATMPGNSSATGSVSGTSGSLNATA